tara:strand:- start:4236 stop:5063 length:828 start_codon:yes stop_codon:yes gene_type:complete
VKLINKTYIKKIVKQALQEDLSPHGDITSILINNKKCFANIIANQNGILSGLDFCKNTFKTIDRKAIFIKKFKDGDRITKGDTVAIIKAKAKSILTAERTALNFLGHASGISTTTNLFVQKVKKKSKICCTRKTSPNLRLLEKYAVKRGGGINHRFNLSDEIMIKDNHIKLEKSLRSLIKKAIKRKKIITVEIDKVFQLKEILGLKFKRILFDNMSIKTLKTCLKLCKNKYETEYSGNVNLGNIKKISNTRVNRISIGSLTHSSKSFDFTLDLIN